MKTSYYKSRSRIQWEVGFNPDSLQALLSKHLKWAKRTQQFSGKINQLKLGFLQLASIGFSFGFLLNKYSFGSFSKKTFFHLRVFQNKVLSFSKYPKMSLDFLICESSHSSVKNLTKLWKCHSRNFFARSSEGLVTCLKHSLEARLPHWQYKKANQAYIQGELWTISSFIKSCPEWSLHLT